MIFYVTEASDRISAWLLPDNPAAVPAVIVSFRNGRSRVHLETNHSRPDLMANGLHPTGECGFEIDPETVPGLSMDADIEIFDAETNLILYRRKRSPNVPIKLFCMETQSRPALNLHRHLIDDVQMHYGSTEIIGEQTLSFLFHVPFQSILVTGALLYPNYRDTIKRHGFLRAALLFDPARELASTLLRFKQLGSETYGEGSWRRLGHSVEIARLAEVDLTSEVELGRALKRVSDETFYSLANPTTRKFAAKTHEEALERYHVAVALDSLAEFDVVGFSDRYEDYAAALEAHLGGAQLPPTVEDDPPELAAVMAAIAKCPPALGLLDLDYTLFVSAREAYEKTLLAFDETTVPV